ncbi:hypothetical protein LSCM4_03958 [Leishmania orientalis]|uniref:Uncharacterized protein n=1 Tax=Leishmania orientalis TaxID=2249476 RepID=A0A836GGU0_9TRYP|nr:hypothetical protein LSCM4_03958 [Leishmania orientalis]
MRGGGATAGTAVQITRSATEKLNAAIHGDEVGATNEYSLAGLVVVHRLGVVCQSRRASGWGLPRWSSGHPTSGTGSLSRPCSAVRSSHICNGTLRTVFGRARHCPSAKQPRGSLPLRCLAVGSDPERTRRTPRVGSPDCTEQAPPCRASSGVCRGVRPS